MPKDSERLRRVNSCAGPNRRPSPAAALFTGSCTGMAGKSGESQALKWLSGTGLENDPADGPVAGWWPHPGGRYVRFPAPSNRNPGSGRSRSCTGRLAAREKRGLGNIEQLACGSIIVLPPATTPAAPGFFRPKPSMRVPGSPARSLWGSCFTRPRAGRRPLKHNRTGSSSGSEGPFSNTSSASLVTTF